MVLEQLFKKEWQKNKSIYSLLIGFWYSLIAFVTSYLLFRPFVGLSTLLFTVILALPSVNKLFESEGKLIKKKDLSFFQRYATIIDFFIYFFIGVFIVFFIISMLAPKMVFSIEDLIPQEERMIEKPAELDGLPPPPVLERQSDEFFNIFKNNVFVMLVSLILSLFYGSGAIFLITFNASIFASALTQVIRIKIPHLGFMFTYSFIACNFGIMFFHTIPEVASYFLAAIAGGILSKAFSRQKFMSKEFRKTFKDSIILMFLAIIVLFIAAVIETYVSKKLFTQNVCVEHTYLIAMILLLVVILLVVFDYLRKRHSKRT